MKRPAILGGEPAAPENVYITKPIVPGIDDFIPAVRDIFTSRTLTNSGPYVQRFEAELAQRLRARNCLAVANGTLALQLLIKGLDLRGAVVTTPFTFPATVHALYWNQITPIFCDVDPETFNLSPAAAEAVLTSDTTGILPVHVFGYPCDVEALRTLAARRGLALFYDASHCFGVEVGDEPIASFGDGSTFSFHATKLFNTMEGGAVAVRDDRLAARLRMFRNFGIQDEETVIGPGINAKMHELTAAFGSLLLKKTDAEIAGRHKIAALYDASLAEILGLRPQRFPANVKRNYQYYPILVDPAEFGLDRNQLHAALKAERIVTRKYFYPLCSDFDCYRHLPSAARGNLPNAAAIADRILCLPIYAEMGEGTAAAIVDAIRAIQREAPAIRARLTVSSEQ